MQKAILMRPFLRWAGGKRWLAAGGVVIPEGGRYVEPFVGGGAIFFSHHANRSLLSDLNPYLINAYQWMQLVPGRLFELTQAHFDLHSKDYYYLVRQRLASATVEDAAAFIYLNRSCFNGLFRVNLDGKFNVPIGTKVYELRSQAEFLQWGEKLSNAQIIESDFEQVICQCGKGDFIFVDPPYTVKHNSNGFIEYNEQIFSWDDQLRLAECLWKAKERGSQFLLTNADHPSVRSLYPDQCVFASRERGSEMAGKAAHRGRTTELLVASSACILERSVLL